MRARSEKRIGSVGSLGANHDAAATRNVLPMQGGADRGNFLRRKLTHKFYQTPFFFFLFEVKLKAAREGRGGEEGRYA